MRSVPRTIYIGRQGQRADTLEERVERRAFHGETQAHRAVAFVLDECGGHVVLAECQDIARPEPAGVAGECVPVTIVEDAVECDPDLRLATLCHKLGADDGRVVGDQQVAWPEERRQVAHLRLRRAPARDDVKQACAVTRARGFQGDIVAREVEIEIGYLHGRPGLGQIGSGTPV